MTTQYPDGLDNFTNPTPANNLNNPTVLHSDQHSNANDAIEALEQWVGVSGSSVPATIEYRVNSLQTTIASGTWFGNLDGGHPDSNYGGITAINAGGA